MPNPHCQNVFKLSWQHPTTVSATGYIEIIICFTLAGHNPLQKKALKCGAVWRTFHTLPSSSNPITISGHHSGYGPESFKKFVVNLGIETSSLKDSSRACLSQQKSFQLISINFWAGSESRGTALSVTACFLYCSFYTPIRFLPTILSKLNCLRV